MSEHLYTELKRLYVKRKEVAFKDGLGEPVPIIFNNKGEHTSQNSVRNIWRRLLTKCGIGYRKLHTTRHTFASMLIFKGESLAYVKEFMGHHSIQMTVDTYGIYFLLRTDQPSTPSTTHPSAPYPHPRKKRP